MLVLFCMGNLEIRQFADLLRTNVDGVVNVLALKNCI